MTPQSEDHDWRARIDELAAGSPAALVEWTRLATGFLVDYRAYDFADDWSDAIQAVESRLLRDARSRQFASNEEVRIHLRFLTCDELRGRLPAMTHWTEVGELPWAECALVDTGERWPPHLSDESVENMQNELENLPEQRSRVLADVFGNGCSFDQVAAQQKLPLRMVKRFLRESFWELRDRCANPDAGESENREDRVKSCFKTMDLDPTAYLIESAEEGWREFRLHYPVCTDCSRVVARLARLESLVRAACGGADRHPPADDLIALQRNADALGQGQRVAVMRHLDGCVACEEAMTLLTRFEDRPFGENLDDSPRPSSSRESSGDDAEVSEGALGRAWRRFARLIRDGGASS